jgi:hypothetical protein
MLKDAIIGFEIIISQKVVTIFESRENVSYFEGRITDIMVLVLGTHQGKGIIVRFVNNFPAIRNDNSLFGPVVFDCIELQEFNQIFTQGDLAYFVRSFSKLA